MAYNLHESSSTDLNMDVEESKNLHVEEMMEQCETEKLSEKEEQILILADLYKKECNSAALANLLRDIKEFLKFISKAKAAKLVKTLVDYILEVESDTEVEVNICKEFVEWAKEERRIFLCQYLEVRLIGLYFNSGMYSEALALSARLLKELKRLEDKRSMVEVLLEESKTHHALKNVPKATASLTSARAISSTIYCPPTLQAALDLQTGILHTTDGKDFKTAFSYFYEAFDTYDKIDSPKALTALKYMILCKIMLNKSNEIQHIIHENILMKYMGRDIEAMKAIADASCKRSLSDFVEIVNTYKKEFEEDDIVNNHLNTLYDRMLEHNLRRIIEPYSNVEIEYIAKRINLGKDYVEKKISQMILDKKLHGILDNGDGILHLFEETQSEVLYEKGLEIIHSMGNIVDNLYQKAKELH